MPSKSGRFLTNLKKNDFITQMKNNGWATEDEIEFVSSAYDILAKDKNHGYLLDELLNTDLWYASEMYRQDTKESFLEYFRDEVLENDSAANLVIDYKRKLKPVSSAAVEKLHSEIMGYPLEERVHRLAEEEREKGKPCLNGYLSKEKFLEGTVMLGWFYDEDQEVMGKLYDELANTPEASKLLMNLTRSDVWTEQSRELTLAAFEEQLSSASITDEQRERIREIISKDDWSTTEHEDEELADAFESLYETGYDEVSEPVQVFRNIYNKISNDTDRYERRIQADESVQREREQLRDENTFAHEFTKEQFKQLAGLNGWPYKTDEKFFDAIYDELSGMPEGKPLLTDIINIRVWDEKTQKKLKNEISSYAKQILKTNEGGLTKEFEKAIEDWNKEDPKQEDINDLYSHLNESDRMKEIEEYNSSYTFSKKEFLEKAFENGWEAAEDRKNLGNIYDYAKANHDLKMGALLERIMDTDVSTYESRGQMSDDINETIRECVPEVVPGGFLSLSHCKDAAEVHTIAKNDLTRINDRKFFDDTLPRARRDRQEEAEFNAFRKKLFKNSWSDKEDEYFAEFLFKAKKFIESNEKYSGNEELKKALEEAENSKPRGMYSENVKGDIFNKLVDTFTEQGLTKEREFLGALGAGSEFSSILERSYNKLYKRYQAYKEREEWLKNKKEEEERRKEEEKRKIEEEKARIREEQEKGTYYGIENDDDDFVIEGGGVVEFRNGNGTQKDHDDFEIEGEVTTLSEEKKNGEEKNKETKTEETKKEENAVNQKPSQEEIEKAAHLAAVDANQASITVLKDIQKQLDTQHRFGIGHNDSQAVIDLRSSLQELIDAKVKHINEKADEQPEVLEATERVYLSSRAYIKKLREEAKVADSNLKWKPKSKMGQKRYEGAQMLEDITGRALGFEEMGEMFPEFTQTTKAPESEKPKRNDSLADIEIYDPRQKADMHAEAFLDVAVGDVKTEIEKGYTVKSPDRKKAVIPLVARVAAAHFAAAWEKNYIMEGGNPLSQNAFNKFTDKIAATLPKNKSFQAFTNNPELSASDLLELTAKDKGKSIYTGMISAKKQLKVHDFVKRSRTAKAKTADDPAKDIKGTENIQRANTVK